jgi:hypothetical protein
MGRHPERSRSSGGAKDLPLLNSTLSEIPSPAGEIAGVRDDAMYEAEEFKLSHYGGSGSVWFAMLRGLCESLAAFAVNRFLTAKIAKNRR